MLGESRTRDSFTENIVLNAGSLPYARMSKPQRIVCYRIRGDGNYYNNIMFHVKNKYETFVPEN